jgi:hypothetical protein
MSCSKIVDYVLAAEFDIDKGSLLSYQYPKPTGCDEGLLAEWMVSINSHTVTGRKSSSQPRYNMVHP